MTTTKSIAISTFTMPAALAAADALLGRPDWRGNPDNQQQMAWLERFRRRAELAQTMKEIRSNATEVADEHVRWLAGQGWEAQIMQGQPGDLFLAAVLNIVAKWKEAGEAYEENGVHRAVVKKGCHLYEAAGQHPMVEIVTQHPTYSFCFQQVDAAPANAPELAERALEMVVRNAHGGDLHLDFPMINMLVRGDASYMLGLSAGKNVVTAAAEQLRLELNEIGGRASAAAEVLMSRGLSMDPRVIKIDGPFIVAISRNGAPADAEKVAFAAYCDRDVWGRPAEGRI